MNIKEIFTDTNGKLSSKRILGFAGLVSFGASGVILALRSSFNGSVIDAEAVNIIKWGLISSAALLGVGVFEGNTK